MRKEVAQRVEKTLQKLPVNYREILMLREVNGFAYAEIADIMGLSKGNSKVMLHRARTKFQETYGIRLLLEEPSTDCAEVSELLHALHDGESLEQKERFVKRHLRDCEACQERRSGW